eukprot:UC1_evm1s1699
MGCGSSKAVAIEGQEAQAQAQAQPKADTVLVDDRTTQSAISRIPSSQPTIIDETTNDNTTSIEKKNYHDRTDGANSITIHSVTSASNKNGNARHGDAPIVLQRPVSRGGVAFELSWSKPPPAPCNFNQPYRRTKESRRPTKDHDTETKNDDIINSGRRQRRPPRRLERLRTEREHDTDGCGRREKTLEELQRKMEAAERRRRDYEARIREKLARDTHQRPAAAVVRREATQTCIAAETVQRISEKEREAEKRRLAHLQARKERQHAREMRAAAVRESKKRIKEAEQAVSASTSTTTTATSASINTATTTTVPEVTGRKDSTTSSVVLSSNLLPATVRKGVSVY